MWLPWAKATMLILASLASIHYLALLYLSMKNHGQLTAADTIGLLPYHPSTAYPEAETLAALWARA